jgi:tetratricopeptide (TPR) repeat protein
MQQLMNFDVSVEPLADGYRTRVVASPAGETHADFTLPFTEKDMTILVLEVVSSIGRVRRKVRRIQSPERKLLEDFGSQLFQSVFAGPVRDCLDRSRTAAEAEGAGLRIRLRLPPALASIPWEYLHDAEYGFVGLSPETALVRYVEMPTPVTPLPVTPPLRVLAMISAPADVPELQGEEEWGKLNEALQDLAGRGMVQVDRLEAGTLAALQRPLRLHDYHVLHFVGHGGYDEEAKDGALALEGADGRSRLVTGRDLGLMLRGHRSLRLVVLNACEGARCAPDDPFSGVAQALVRQGVPAVIAMQFEISDPAALVFSQSLYQAIADGFPIDLAMVEARRAMFAEGNEVEWATPVLYLRAPDGRVFTKDRSPDAGQQAPEAADRQAREDAERQAREAAEQHARDLATRYTLACAAADARDWEQALIAFMMIADVEPGYRDVRERAEAIRRQQQIEALQAEARRHHQARQWEAVIRTGERLYLLDPAAADPEGMVTSARNELAATRQTDRLEADYQTALRLLDAGHWHQAIDKLERIVQVNPAYRAAPALLNRARRQLAEAKPPPQQPSAAQAKPPPRQPSAAGGGRRPSGRPADGTVAHVSQGKSLCRAHRYADAEAAYRAALALDPHLAVAHAGLGDALNGQRRSAEAETACREAIRLDPSLTAARAGLGRALCRTRRFADAEAACREAIPLNPGFAPSHAILGLALLGSDRYADSEAACREAIRLDPGLAEAYNYLGLTLVLTKRLTEAEASFREAIRLDPGFAAAHCNLGVVAFRTKRYSAAETSFREAIRLDPGLEGGHRGLGDVLMKWNRHREAEEAYREAARVDPNVASANRLNARLAKWTRWISI